VSVALPANAAAPHPKLEGMAILTRGGCECTGTLLVVDEEGADGGRIGSALP